uniref:PH domain-containing protein n=1 Tax=Anas platyrhynchos TaxID=8839 RepID=A0A8B9SX25_ANAPL
MGLGGGFGGLLGVPVVAPRPGCPQESCPACIKLCWMSSASRGLRTSLCHPFLHFPGCSSSPPRIQPAPHLSLSLSPPAQLPATKPSGCKTFWKRCQGLVRNTWGSLRRKRKPPRQPAAEEVTAPGEAACGAERLHGVNPPAASRPGLPQPRRDTGGLCVGRPRGPGGALPARGLGMPGEAFPGAGGHRSLRARRCCWRRATGKGPGSSSGTPQPAKRPPAASCRPPAPGSGTPPASHTLPKASTGSLFNSLQRRERARAEQARLLTLQGIMGASSLQPLPEERHGPSNTWPLKCGWRKAAGPPGPQLGELLLYVKNPLVRDIDAECGAAPRHPKPRLAPPGAARRPGPKATCPHLALGSVLSLELPKDVAVLGRLRDAAPPEEEEEEERKGRGVRWWEPPGEDTGGHGPQQPGNVLGASPKAERGTWLEEVSFNPSSGRHKVRGPRAAHGTGEERRSPRHPGSTRQHLPDSRPGRQPHEQDLLPTRLEQGGSPRASCRARHREAAHLEMGTSPTSTPHRAGAIPTAQHPPSSTQPVGSPASPAAPTQLSVFEWALGSPQPPSPVRGAQEVCHPAHGQFEEEEEELQAIWDGAGERRAPGHPPGSPPGSDTAGGPLILSSANNVLVAKFTLPSAARILQSPAGGKGHAGSPQGHGAAPCLEGTVAVPPSDSPAAWDRRRQRDEEREGGQAPAGKTEFQMMEGTLERKHVLQAGGRKASCRAWGLFHAVLMRQTLCFYQDRRDSLKSSVVALPLNLAGAVCAPDSEYTKKTNCFRLQLRDGSEYLLRAPSQPLMNEWVSKLQQNSGFPEVDYFQAAAQCVEGASFSPLQGPHQAVTAKSPEIVVLPRSNARLQLPQDAQDGHTDGTSAAEDVCGAASPTAGRREQQRSPRTSPGLWDNGCPDEDDCGLVANKRRSYSFTSATYQKITPLAVPQEPREAGGSYSVTLYIGEQAAAVPRARCRSFVARPGSPRDALGEKPPGAPRPKNKSVFKKFFGKKE